MTYAGQRESPVGPTIPVDPFFQVYANGVFPAHLPLKALLDLIILFFLLFTTNLQCYKRQI